MAKFENNRVVVVPEGDGSGTRVVDEGGDTAEEWASWHALVDTLPERVESDLKVRRWRYGSPPGTLSVGMLILEVMQRDATVADADRVFGPMLTLAEAARADQPVDAAGLAKRPGFYWCETMARAWALMVRRCRWDGDAGADVLMKRLRQLCALVRGWQPEVPPATAEERAGDLAELKTLCEGVGYADAVLREDEWRMSGRDGRRAVEVGAVFLVGCRYAGEDFVKGLLALGREADARWVEEGVMVSRY